MVIADTGTATRFGADAKKAANVQKNGVDCAIWAKKHVNHAKFLFLRDHTPAVYTKPKPLNHNLAISHKERKQRRSIDCTSARRLGVKPRVKTIVITKREFVNITSPLKNENASCDAFIGAK
jgi:hypothetical protein